jgi:hypothetical protein
MLPSFVGVSFFRQVYYCKGNNNYRLPVTSFKES